MTSPPTGGSNGDESTDTAAAPISRNRDPGGKDAAKTVSILLNRLEMAGRNGSTVRCVSGKLEAPIGGVAHLAGPFDVLWGGGD